MSWKAIHSEHPERLFASLVTGDESWFHHHTLKSKGDPCSGSMMEVLASNCGQILDSSVW
jgi:hypothetical protein